MLPAIYNPTIKQGVPFRRRLGLSSDDGNPLSLIGATAVGQIRSADGLQVLADFNFTIPPDTDEEFEWLLLDTTILPSTNGQAILPYDVYITPANGDRICPVEGLIEVEAARTVLQ